MDPWPVCYLSRLVHEFRDLNLLFLRTKIYKEIRMRNPKKVGCLGSS